VNLFSAPSWNCNIQMNLDMDEIPKIRIQAVYRGVFLRSKTDVPVYNQNHSFFGEFIINLHAVLMCYETFR